MKRFTILTATYNKPQYLREAARSVFAQTASDWEWWIVLDGPNAETELVARELQTVPGVRVFIESTIEGQRASSYRPAVIFDQYMPIAETPFLCWLSDDDLWEPRFLESLVEPMERDPAINVTCGGARVIWKDGDAWIPAYEVEATGKSQRDLIAGMGSDSTLLRREAYHRAGLPKAASSVNPAISDKVVLRALATLVAVPGIVMTHRVTELSRHRDLFLLKQKRRSRRSAKRAKRLSRS